MYVLSSPRRRAAGAISGTPPPQNRTDGLRMSQARHSKGTDRQTPPSHRSSKRPVPTPEAHIATIEVWLARRADEEEATGGGNRTHRRARHAQGRAFQKNSFHGFVVSLL